jgi:hypothetical protein
MFVKLRLVDGIEGKRNRSDSVDSKSMTREKSPIPAQDALQVLFEFATTIQKNYFDNPYHSFYHAIDVTYIVYYLMEDMSLADQLDLTFSDKAILLISALGHDVLHPGTNNLYQVLYID